jgi:alcohol dehydrogenase class IV
MSHPISDFRMPGNLRFGVNSLSTLPDEIKRFKASKIALISDKGVEGSGIVRKVLDILETTGIPVYTFTEIKGEPTFRLLKETVQTIRQEQCDLVVGIGGGSVMDVAKTVAALLDKSDITDYLSGAVPIETKSVPCILLPTTSGTGSEVTMNAIFGDEEQEVKRGLVSPVLLPDLAIIDPMLTISCPPRVTAASGVDAFTHAIESYVALRANSHTQIYAEKAMKLFPLHITRAVHQGDLEARIGMCWVSNLAGVSLANAGVGAVHALAYPLGGKYHVEHGIANALLMPYVFEVTGLACTEQMVNIAGFLQLGDYRSKPYAALDAVVQYLKRLLVDLDLPTSLRQLGIDEASLPLLAEQASKIERLLLNTPYKLNKDKILRIYQNAYIGM